MGASDSKSLVGEYKRLKFIGGGSFGDAYLVEGKSDSMKYVLKEVDKMKLTDQEQADTHREIEVLRALFHPNIVQFKDTFINGNKVCIVMEYCENGDLYERVTKTDIRLTEDEIWEWFVQLCKALEYMHSCRVVHRDLTTKNIFISRDETLRVGDFGLSKRYSLQASRQLSRQTIGAALANPPEMLNDSAAPVSDKMDVWAAGTILYFMIMRRLAFVKREQDRDYHIVPRIKAADYDPIPNSVSEGLRKTVKWLFTIEPTRRPSIREVLSSPTVSAYTNPADRLKKVYGLEWKVDTLLDTTGQSVKQNYHGNNVRDNQTRYEGIAELMTEELYNRMLKLELRKLSVPKRRSFDPRTDHPDPDFDNPGTVIFCSRDYVVAEKLLVLIHGGGDNMRTRAGQWARRTMIYSKSIESGTQLPYIRAALLQGYGLIILNGNDKRPDIEGCRSFEEHTLYVWENYVMRSEAAYIAIKSHSNGGIMVRSLYQKFGDHFRTKVYANAFTGDNAVPMPIDDYTKKVSRSWVVSHKLLGEAVEKDSPLDCFSAGTDEHSLTPHKAFVEVFKFIEERFRDSSPGNLQS